MDQAVVSIQIRKIRNLTDQNLKSRIADEKGKLIELQQQIKSQNEEIISLKGIIKEQSNIDARSRSTQSGNFSSTPRNVEPSDLVLRNHNHDRVVTPLHFNAGTTNSDDEVSIMVEHDEFEEEEEQSRRPRSQTKNKRDRSRSKSRSKSWDKRRRRRSRSRSGADTADTLRDPNVQKLVQRMVSEQVAAELKKRSGDGCRSGERPNTGNPLPKFKSPSEATMYTPAINPMDANNGNQEYVPLVNNWMGEVNKDRTPVRHVSPNKFDVNKVNEVISQLRIGTSGGDPQPSTSRQGGLVPPQVNQGRSAAEAAILEAERFKAQIQQPNRGIVFNNPYPGRCEENQIRHLRYLDEDDEFFHTICHVDESIREKISKGGFVELCKLIQENPV